MKLLQRCVRNTQLANAPRLRALLGTLILLLLIPSGAGAVPHFDFGNDGWFLLLILVAISPYFLAPLFSIIFLVSTRGACKWAAIIFTGILLIFQAGLAGFGHMFWISLLPDICILLIATKFWLRTGPARYPLAALAWGIAVIHLAGGLSGGIVRLFRPASTGSWMIYTLAIGLIVSAFVAWMALRGNARRGLPIPPLAQFALFMVVISAADSFLSIGLTELSSSTRFGRYGRGGITLHYEYLALRISVAAAAGIIAWYRFDGRRSRLEPPETEEVSERPSTDHA